MAVAVNAPSPHSQLWRWEIQQAIIALAAGGGSGGGGGIPEAPVDGQQYGRQSSAWSVIPAADTGTTILAKLAPVDGAGSGLDADTLDGQHGNYYAAASSVPLASSTTPLMDGTAAVGVGATWARADHVHPTDSSRAPLASPALTGVPTAPTPVTTDSSTALATTAFVKAQGYVTSSGVTAVTGTAPVVSSGGATPAISMAAATTTVPGYLTAADWTTFNAKAPTASPTFTGTPAAPTPVTTDSSTTIATTAFVKNQGYATVASVPVASSTTPIMDGTAAIGTGTTWARADHVHPSDTTKANLASPTFTGIPAAPTPATSDSSTALATTAFVKAQGYVTSSGVTSVTGTAPVSSSGGATPVISMAAATTAVDGYLKALDWTTFNNKEPAIAVGTTTQYWRGDKSWQTLNATAVGLGNVSNTAQVTSVSGTAPVVSSGGLTPVISMAAATTSAPGYLTAADWTTFNSKLADAPNDGTLYGRKSGAWSPVVSGGVIIADTLPVSAAAGQMCWESDTGNLYAYYTDVDSSQWVMIAASVVPGGSTASGRTPGEIATFAMTTVPAGWLECDGSTVSRTLYPSLFTAIGTTYGAGDGSTTFGIPDLRGQFVRGWDHGKGVDSGRVFGSAQAGDTIAHTHAISITSGINSNDHTHSFSVTTGYVSNDHSHTQAGTWGSGGRSAAHTHTPSNGQNYVTAGGPNASGSGLGYQQCAGSGTESADHSHNTAIGGQTSGISANHTHGVSGNTSGISANHTHAVTGTSASTGTETRPVNVAMLMCIKY